MITEEQMLVINHPSYHQMLTEKEAEERLQKYGNHNYLTRYSESRQCYKLSVHEYQRPKHVFQHFQIVKYGNRLKIKGTHKYHEDLDSLLRYYEHHRINPALETIGTVYTQAQHRSRRCIIM